MPKDKKKRKAESSESDSDSGPEDRGPAPKKPVASKSTKKKEDDEFSATLGKNKFVKVREYAGKIFVDIREFYEKDGELHPGKKGIALTVDQYNKLKDVLPDVDEALSKL